MTWLRGLRLQSSFLLRWVCINYTKDKIEIYKSFTKEFLFLEKRLAGLNLELLIRECYDVPVKNGIVSINGHFS